MSVYLEDHPPARTQYRKTRRGIVTGAIVVHTAEAGPDLTGPDGAAEAVAAFISNRTDAAASYHSVVDSDSIVHVGRYEWEMFHEGTGGNRWSLGLSMATRAALWPTLPEFWRAGAVHNAAREAANMAKWVHAQTGVLIPARRITASQYRSGQPGFVGHGELDPTRRSDPGAGFPWDQFLAGFSEEMGQPTPGHKNFATGEGIYDETRGYMATERKDYVRQIQEMLNANGALLEPDDKMGPATASATKNVLAWLNGEIKNLQARMASAEADLRQAATQRTVDIADMAALRVQLDEANSANHGKTLQDLLAALDAATDAAREALGWE